ncbi:hypothetical protein RB5829 [Rhodopirellula baltica SH 1]|uniref:Uncharacterized protein n=1 Tax=Rhodopirellula baltica (strain DSM 10527 / NCIMB 13988 / SH1) TaxID=243090 RepID=Q7UR83_RHOBA|nr:hypothetical protein RB5829 [Rhodopirellula baltica SH 1]
MIPLCRTGNSPHFSLPMLVGTNPASLAADRTPHTLMIYPLNQGSE